MDTEPTSEHTPTHISSATSDSEYENEEERAYISLILNKNSNHTTY